MEIEMKNFSRYDTRDNKERKKEENVYSVAQLRYPSLKLYSRGVDFRCLHDPRDKDRARLP